MIKNYLKTALRNLWKYKGYSFLNIIGLAAGLAVCLLIVLYVVDELSYDRYNKNSGRIYRLQADIYFNSTQANFAVSPDPLGPALAHDYPQIEQMVRFNYQSDILVKKDNQYIQDHNAVFVDSTLFQVFTLPMLKGNPQTALRDPGSIIIDETTAKKYFNSIDVVGQLLTIDNNIPCKVSGVIRDIPRQSHFHFHFIRPRTKDQANDSWLSNNTFNYVLVKPGVTQQQLQQYVDATINNYLGKDLEQQVHTSLKDLEGKGNHFIYHAVPVTDIHLHSSESYQMEAGGELSYVYIFSIIAGFILLIACVNFMNLSTARSANRSKEVGIRKVAGSLRRQLIMQFLAESILVGFFSLLLALAIAVLLLPLFNQLSGKEIHVANLFSGWQLPILVTLILVVGLLAGSYPALYLSSFRPVEVLKGKVASGFKSSRLRSGLVVFQFTISIVLIVGTIIIYRQLEYIRNHKLGYNREQVLVLHNAYNLGQKIKTFREELLNLPQVTNASISGDLPTSSNFDNEGWFRDAGFDATRAVVLTNFFVDEQYIPTLGMEMKEGRNFSKDFPTDSTAVILNEAAVKVLGLKNPFEETLYRPRFENGNIVGPQPFHVVGIVRDFNFSSLHQAVGPVIIQLGENWGSISVRLNTGDPSSVISQVEAKWKTMVPGQPFSYSFMDADFNNIYTAEQRTGRLFIAFAVFAIFIACLGLFGLVTYAAEQRTKEIGVRKVLGASVRGIVTMLSRDFARLVLIAALIAFPLAWWAMHRWLETFAYRANIAWWVFPMAGILAIVIALVTVSFQATRAALANPVRSIRSE
jgi:putative ABC transport system permease protein